MRSAAKNRILYGAAVVLFLGSSIGAFAQAGSALSIFSGGPDAAARASRIEWDFSIEPNVARRGEVVTFRAHASLQESWYIYSHTLEPGGPQATKFKFDLPEGLAVHGGIDAPKPKVKFDKGFEMDIEYYPGEVQFEQKLIIAGDAPLGELAVAGSVRFQICNDTTCLPPRPETFAPTVTIEDGPARAAYLAPATPALPEPTETRVSPTAGQTATVAASGGIDDVLKAGFFIFLFTAIANGLLALLTPCVYPMIPITVSFFLKQGEKEGRRPLALASTYAVSIIVTFTAIGLLAAIVYGPGGVTKLAGSWSANLFLAVVFVAFALSLFGLYEIQVPVSVQNWFSRKGQSGGYGGTVFMGVAFALASFACTAPFIGALLALAAGGDWFWPLVGMLGFSFAFAMPFFLLALFPQFLARMPRSGGWLNSVKVVMGFLILAASFKFLGNVDQVLGWGVFTRDIVLAAWVMTAVFAGFYLLGKIQLSHDTPLERIGVGRMLLSLSFLTLGLYLSVGLFGGRISGTLEAYLPPPSESVAAAQVAARGEPAIEWIDDYDKALEVARAEKKPLFVDFSGRTCTNCHLMERTILARTDVRKALKRFVPVRLLTDVEEKWSEMQVKRFGTAALPFYAIISPEDSPVARFEGLTRDHEEFLTFLGKGLTRPDSAVQ